jgi:hypothetical protein
MMYEKDLFPDISIAKDEMASPEGMIAVEPGALSSTPKPKYEFITAKNPLIGLDGLIGFAASSTPQAAGVSQNYFVGAAEDLKRTANQSIQSLREQNLVTLSVPFDALRLYKKRQARLVLGFVSQFMQDGQIMRILGSEGSIEMVKFIKDEATQEFDIVVDQAPASATSKQEIFDMMTQNGLLPQLLKLGFPIPPSLAKFFPFPAEVNAEWQQMFELAQQLQLQQLTQPPVESGDQQQVQ